MESLATFSEFALALAGFASIALVLGQRGDSLPPGAVYVVRYMVINALGPALLALLAIVLLEAGVPETRAWRLCSAVYLSVAAFVGALSARQQRTLSRSSQLLFGRVPNLAIWGAAFLAHALQLANLVGFPAEPSLGLFLAGLWVLLAVAGVQFVALLFVVLG